MMNALKEAASAASNYFSPETERKNQENENQESAKNIDEFLTRHFNTRFIKSLRQKYLKFYSFIT